jgi:SLT domain-containing protein
VKGTYPTDRALTGEELNQAIDEADAALQATGRAPLTESEKEAVRIVAQNESDLIPGAQNNWDENAQNGIPSQGLMQVIPPTFADNGPAGGDPFNPVDSIFAAVNYADKRYGGIDQTPGYLSVVNGGPYLPY